MKATNNLSFRFEKKDNRVECSCWSGDSRMATCGNWQPEFDFVRDISETLLSLVNDPASKYFVAVNLYPEIQAAWSRDYSKFKNTHSAARN